MAIHLDFVMSLPREQQLTAYNAAYLELALRVGVAPATDDRELDLVMPRAGGVVFGDAMEGVS